MLGGGVKSGVLKWNAAAKQLRFFLETVIPVTLEFNAEQLGFERTEVFSWIVPF